MSLPDSPSDLFSLLGLRTAVEDGVTRGRSRITPGKFAPGTQRLRFGFLATLVDIVGGTPPTGPLNPTVDMRIRLLAPMPASGTVVLECRPVKHGARLYLAEVVVCTDSRPEPFAIGVTTFVNQLIGSPPRRRGAADDDTGDGGGIAERTLDEALGARPVGPDVLELDMHGGVHNPVTSTIMGGFQALLAELAAEHVLAPRGPHQVVDLDIRYVNRVLDGPVLARAEVLPGAPLDPAGSAPVPVRVVIVEPTPDGDRTISLVHVACVPASA